MMFTEDYIKRMISQALAVLLTALGLKKAGKYREALQSYDQAVESLVGLPAPIVNQLDDSTLLDKLTSMGQLDIERVLILADIYLEEFDVFRLLAQPANSRFSALRSLRLYLEAALASEAIPDRELIGKIEQLRHAVDISAVPVETRLALQDYIERLLASSSDVLAANGLDRTDLQAAFTALDELNTQ